ncbi:MAG TPA: hypothetical protein VEF76_03495, partial [Patescibacteria group bacterium]|nr:hypothetical protein [Patescibacteria group bacterium]
MAQLRQVRDTFEKLINDNNSSVRKLEESIRDIQGKRGVTEKTYDTAIERFASALFWPSLDEENLGKLKTALNDSFDFVQNFKDSMTASREAEIRLNGLTATHGEIDAVADKVRSIQKQINKAEEAEQKLGDSISDATRSLRPVEAFNSTAKEGAAKLEAGSIDYFSSKTGIAHAWSWLVNGHYRRGRAVIKELKEQGQDIVSLQKQLKVDKEALPAAQKLTADLAVERKKFEVPLKEMSAVAEGVYTEQAIAEGLKLQVVGLLEDRDFFNKVATELKDVFPASAVELRAKLEGFDKLEAGARASIKGLKSATEKLDKHMYKIRQGASRKPYHDVKVDLEKTEKAFKAQQVLANHKAQEITKASKRIDTYSAPPTVVYTNNSPLDFYMGFMIADMLGHSHHSHDHAASAAAAAGDSSSPVATDAGVPAGQDLFTPGADPLPVDSIPAVDSVDPSVLNDTLGIPDDIAAGANLDLDNLSPSLSDSDLSSLGLGDTFNDAAGNIDVGTIDVGNF